MSDNEETNDFIDDGDDDNLFGDDGDESDNAPATTHNERARSDDDLASDPGSEKRYGGDGDDEQDGGHTEFKTKTFQALALFRHRTPMTKDGNLQVVKVPDFLKLQPTEYQEDLYEPDEWDLANSRAEIPRQAIRYRRNPETGELQSNATICKWSDGSLSLMVGEEHFVIQVKEMGGRVPNKPYNAQLDSHTYAAAAHIASQGLLTVGHVCEQYTIRPDYARTQADVLEFEKIMKNAKGDQKGEMIITTTKDPELQKREAEMAEKERSRQQRKRDNAAAKIDGTGSAYRRGGLSIGDIEGGRRTTGAAGRKRGQPGSSKQKRRGRRDDYDSEEEYGGGGRAGENYDMEDDFIAPSDEEGADSGVEDEEEEEEILDDDDEPERPRAKRQKTADASDVDADADDAPSSAPAPSGGDHVRRGRRTVIDDDDDEDE